MAHCHQYPYPCVSEQSVAWRQQPSLGYASCKNLACLGIFSLMYYLWVWGTQLRITFILASLGQSYLADIVNPYLLLSKWVGTSTDLPHLTYPKHVPHPLSGPPFSLTWSECHPNEQKLSPIPDLRINLSISLWNIVMAFIKPKGICWYWNNRW